MSTMKSIVVKTDEYGKPLQDGYFEVWLSKQPLWKANGQVDEHYETVLRWNVADFNGFDSDSAAGLKIRHKDGEVCFNWDIVIQYHVMYNSDAYVEAMEMFREQCEHAWLEAVHHPLIGCYKMCGKCDSRVNPHGGDNPHMDIVDK